MNLIEGIQNECTRLRDELIPEYELIGPSGHFAIAMMRASIREGEAAIASDDIVRMVKACKDLQGYSL